MSLEQSQQQSVWHAEPHLHSQASLVEVQKDLLDARRELLRWKVLASQREERLKEMENSLSWRYAVVTRILRELLRRWKLLLLLALVALVSLPLWPVLILVAILPAGRRLIWSLSAKVAPLRRFLIDVRGGFLWISRLSGRPASRGEVSKITPLIYQRPEDEESPGDSASEEQIRWRVLQQLCPQRRLLLRKFNLTRTELVRDDEMPELLSLSRSELSLLNMIAIERGAKGVSQGRYA